MQHINGRQKLMYVSLSDISRQDANDLRDHLLSRVSANSAVRMLGVVRTAINHAIVEHSLNIPNVFTNLRIKGAGASKLDRLPLSDTQVVNLEVAYSNDTTAWALFVCLRDTGCRVSEIAGLRVKDCDTDKGCLIISPTPWRTLKTNNSQRSVPLSPEAQALVLPLVIGEDLEALLFSKYAQLCGKDSASGMIMKRFRKLITHRKLAMHSLRHRMKDKLRNTGCPEAVSTAILGYVSNTVVANYRSDYAPKVMQEHIERVWQLAELRFKHLSDNSGL